MFVRGSIDFLTQMIGASDCDVSLDNGGDPSRRRTLASIYIRHDVGGQTSW